MYQISLITSHGKHNLLSTPTCSIEIMVNESQVYSNKTSTRVNYMKFYHVKYVICLPTEHQEFIRPHLKCPCILGSNWNLEMLVFDERGKPSKCGKNKKKAHSATPRMLPMFLPHVDVICDLLLNRYTATWNLFVNCTCRCTIN